MAKLGTTLDISSDKAATVLAEFANITGLDPSNFERMGSVLASLSDETAATSSTISDIALRISAAADIAGFSETDIFALAAALGSLGIQSEAAGSAMGKVIGTLQKAVELNEGLDDFASIAGLSSEQFKEMWSTDAIGALNLFVQGLNSVDRNGKTAIAVLDDLGMNEIRLTRAMLSLSQSGDLLTNTLATANTAWDENTALMDKAAIMYDTTESKFKLLENSTNILQTAIGDKLTPALSMGADALGEVNLVTADFIEANQWLVPAITGLSVGLGILAGGVVAYTVVTKAAAVVTAAFSTALTASPVGPIIIGLSALAAVLTTISIVAANAEAAYTTYVESMEKAVEIYESATLKLSELETELATVEERLTVLRGIDAPTLAERSEIDKLKITNEQLQIQLDLQREIANESAKKSESEAVSALNEPRQGFVSSYDENGAYSRLPGEITLTGEIEDNIKYYDYLKQKVLELSDAQEKLRQSNQGNSGQYKANEKLIQQYTGTMDSMTQKISDNSIEFYNLTENIQGLTSEGQQVEGVISQTTSLLGEFTNTLKENSAAANAKSISELSDEITTLRNNYLSGAIGVDEYTKSLESQQAALNDLESTDASGAYKGITDLINQYNNSLENDTSSKHFGQIQEGIQGWKDAMSDAEREFEKSEIDKQFKLWLSDIELIEDTAQRQKAFQAYDEALKLSDSALKTFDETTKDAVDSLSELNKVTDTLNRGNSLTADEILNLASKYPQLLTQIYKTADGWGIETEALDVLRQALIDEQTIALDSQIKKTEQALTATLSRIEAYNVEITAIQNLATAQAEANKIARGGVGGSLFTDLDYNHYVRLQEATGEAIQFASEEAYNAAKKSEGEAINQINTLGGLMEKAQSLKELLNDRSLGVSPEKEKKSDKEIFTADIESSKLLQAELAKVKDALAEVREEQENATDTNTKLSLYQSELNLLKQQQDILKNINSTNASDISDELKLLNDNGINVEYKPELNQAEFSQSIQEIESAINSINLGDADKTNDMRKNLESAVDSIFKFNDGSADNLNIFDGINREIQDINLELLNVEYNDSVSKTTGEYKTLEHELNALADTDVDGKIAIINKQVEIQESILEDNNSQYKILQQALADGTIEGWQFDAAIKSITESSRGAAINIKELNSTSGQMELDKLEKQRDAYQEILEISKDIVKQNVENQVDVYEGEIENWEDLKDIRDEEIDGIEKLIDARDKADDERKKNLDDQLDDYKDRHDQLMQDAEDEYDADKKIFDQRKRELEDQRKEEEKLHDNNMDALKKEADQQKKNSDNAIHALEKEKDSYREIIDLKLKSLQQEQEDKSYQDELSEHQKGIQNVTDRLAEIRQNGSSDAKKERLELLEELSEKEKALSDFQYEHSMQNQEKALEDEYDRYEKSKDTEITAINEAQEAYDIAHEQKLADLEAENERKQELFDVDMQRLEDEETARQEDYELEKERLDDEMERKQAQYDKDIENIEIENQKFVDNHNQRIAELEAEKKGFDDLIKGKQEQIEALQETIDTAGELTREAAKLIDEEMTKDAEGFHRMLVTHLEEYKGLINADLEIPWDDFNGTMERGVPVLDQYIDKIEEIAELSAQLDSLTASDMDYPSSSSSRNSNSSSSSSSFSSSYPIRSTLENMGWNVDWDDDDDTFTVTNPFSGKSKTFRGSKYQYDNGKLYATSSQLQDIIDNLPQYAKGTSYHSGGLAIVGEEGPEIVNLPRGSSVIPASETKAYDTSNWVRLDPTELTKGFSFNNSYNVAEKLSQQMADDYTKKFDDLAKLVNNNQNTTIDSHDEIHIEGVTSENFINKVLPTVIDKRAQAKVDNWQKASNNSSRMHGVVGKFSPR